MLLKKKIYQPPYHLYFLVSIYSLLLSSHSLGFFFNEHLSYSPQSGSFCSYFFVAGCPPSCHMHIPLCHLLSFVFHHLPFLLYFHTLSSSTFSPFLLITSKTGLLILPSPKGPSSVSTVSPSFGWKCSLLTLLLFLPHAGHNSEEKRKDLIFSFNSVP